MDTEKRQELLDQLTSLHNGFVDWREQGDEARSRGEEGASVADLIAKLVDGLLTVNEALMDVIEDGALDD